MSHVQALEVLKLEDMREQIPEDAQLGSVLGTSSNDAHHLMRPHHWGYTDGSGGREKIYNMVQASSKVAV